MLYKYKVKAVVRQTLDKRMVISERVSDGT